MQEAIYKILSADQWATAERDGVFTGSPVDDADGYIHLSSASQVRETAAKHFAEQADLTLLTVDPARCPPGALRWEPSRGGQLFPHLYAPLDLGWVVRAEALPLGPGGHRFPALG